MREFVVSKAPQNRVAMLARATVEDAGGIISQHTPRVTEFDSMVPEAGDWSRSGYVGTYQNHGEEPVRVRIKVWSKWPRTVFLWTLFVGFIQAILFFGLSVVGLSPPPNVWVLTAAATFAVLGIALILYASSWADSQEIEDQIARGLKDRLLNDEAIEGHVYTLGEWEEHTYELQEAAIKRAKEKAPTQPSTVGKAWESVTGRVKGTGASLVQHIGKEPDDATEPDAPDPDQEPVQQDPQRTNEPTQAVEPEEGDLDGDAHDDDEDGASWKDRFAFWRSSDAPPEPEPTMEQDPAEDIKAKRERLKALKEKQKEKDEAS